jgi:hypothetical protein
MPRPVRRPLFDRHSNIAHNKEYYLLRIIPRLSTVIAVFLGDLVYYGHTLSGYI